MIKTYLIFFIIILGLQTTYSTEYCDSLIQNQKVEYDLYQSEFEESRITMKLKTMKTIINMKTIPTFTFKDSLEFFESVYSKDSTQINQKENVTIIDSVYIKLKSGVTWEISEIPPKEPRNLAIKAATVKGRSEKSVSDRLDYLEFCAWYEKYGISNCLLDGFEKVAKVFIDDKLSYRLVFEIKYNADQKLEITSKDLIKIE